MTTGLLMILGFFGVLTGCVTGVCQQNFYEINNNCFHFNNTKLTSWNKGRELCQDLGGDLAVLDDCQTFAEVIRSIYLYDVHVPDGMSYWIGGSDSGGKNEGDWSWLNNNTLELGPPFWGSTKGVPEPSNNTEQNCAVLFKDDRYYIHDAKCNKFNFALCQRAVEEISKEHYSGH